ncbi:hypothetical protein [Pseudoduganella sp. HUAS MS19]
MHRFARLCAALLLSCATQVVPAEEQPRLDVTVDVRHVAKDLWRVDYRFARPVTAIRLGAVDDYRAKAWKVLGAGMRMRAGPEFDILSSDGKPFSTASIEIRTFDGVPGKNYAPFNRFTDGGTAIFLGHLQGDAELGKQAWPMRADIRLSGWQQENVIAPPKNRMIAGGPRGYAYFGPAHAAQAGAAHILLDPKTPDWLRDTVLDAGAKLSGYYEKAYQRPLRDELFIMLSVAGFEAPGLSIKGGAVMGQLSYRVEGAQLAGDHPKKRDYVARLVAHEMAHLWQLNIARGGIGEDEPWIHEGGAEAMALDGLLQTGISSADSVKAYRAAQSAACDRLGQSVASYDGIYACGLQRFEQLGVGIVPLWRSLMQASEEHGAVYSKAMLDGIVRQGLRD